MINLCPGWCFIKFHEAVLKETWHNQRHRNISDTATSETTTPVPHKPQKKKQEKKQMEKEKQTDKEKETRENKQRKEKKWREKKK